MATRQWIDLSGDDDAIKYGGGGNMDASGDGVVYVGSGMSISGGKTKIEDDVHDAAAVRARQTGERRRRRQVHPYGGRLLCRDVAGVALEPSDERRRPVVFIKLQSEAASDAESKAKLKAEPRTAPTQQTLPMMPPATTMPAMTMPTMTMLTMPVLDMTMPVPVPVVEMLAAPKLEADGEPLGALDTEGKAAVAPRVEFMPRNMWFGRGAVRLKKFMTPIHRVGDVFRLTWTWAVGGATPRFQKKKRETVTATYRVVALHDEEKRLEAVKQADDADTGIADTAIAPQSVDLKHFSSRSRGFWRAYVERTGNLWEELPAAVEAVTPPLPVFSLSRGETEPVLSIAPPL